jgi:hypothetical protein
LFSGSSDNEITVEEASFVHTEPPQNGSAPPVATSDMEDLHAKVKKHVIKEGHGKKPSKFATCFGKYGKISSFHTYGLLVSAISLIPAFVLGQINVFSLNLVLQCTTEHGL